MILIEFMIDPADVSVKIVTQLGQIGLWLKAAGIIFVLWLIFQSVTLIVNMRRIKEIRSIKEDMKRMESKLNKLIRKK